LCIQNVGREGVIHHELIEKGMKTKHLHKFLTELPTSNDTKHHLLMDNLSVHKATKSCQKLGLSTIRELLESKNIEPIYLPPYTPELNPTELCFNFIRQQVEKNKPRTYEELKSVTYAQQILEEAPLESLPKLVSDPESIASIIEFMVKKIFSRTSAFVSLRIHLCPRRFSILQSKS